MKTQTQNTEPGAFGNFKDLAKKLFAVPKKELDEKLKEFKVRQQKKRAVT